MGAVRGALLVVFPSLVHSETGEVIALGLVELGLWVACVTASVLWACDGKCGVGV